MSANINKALLAGRLGQDPELKYTPSGNAVTTFSIATNEYWIDKTSGQKQERTEWHRVVLWGKLAERANQYLKKGRSVFIEGRIQTRSWEQDGVKRYTTEIVANNFQFLDTQNSSALPPEEKVPDLKDINMPSETTFNSEEVPF